MVIKFNLKTYLRFYIILILNINLCLQNPCKNEIYCKGLIYDFLQESSKDFINKKLLAEPSEVISVFKKLTMNGTEKDLSLNDQQSFVDEFFSDEKENIDFQVWDMPDKEIQKPAITRNRNLSVFLDYLKKLILQMGIKGTKNMQNHKNRYSLRCINGFIKRNKSVREAYYWETYWVISGLLFYEMYETAKVILDGLISMVIEFDFVPKGNRIYYIPRSNPPFLTLMAYNFFLKTRNYPWLTANIKHLEKELMFWVNNRSIIIEKNGKSYTMFRYSVNVFSPRPELYSKDHLFTISPKKNANILNELHSVSESGWDSSSRWYLDENHSVSDNLNITQVIPVDLNSYLYKNFLFISKLFNGLGDHSKYIFWREKSDDLQQAIHDILWNENEGIWFDYDIKTNQTRNQYYISNFAPLWAKAFPDNMADKYGELISDYIDKFDLIENYKGCIPDSLVETGNFFDFPSSHSHLVAMLIQGLRESVNKEAIKKADLILFNWMDAIMVCWAETGVIFDAYNAKGFGDPARKDLNGDYIVTAGAFLDMLDNYFSVMESRITDEGFACKSNTLVLFMVSFYHLILFLNFNPLI